MSFSAEGPFDFSTASEPPEDARPHNRQRWPVAALGAFREALRVTRESGEWVMVRKATGRGPGSALLSYAYLLPFGAEGGTVMNFSARQDLPSRSAVLRLRPESYRRLLVARLRLLRLRHCPRSLWFGEFSRTAAIIRSGS